MFFFIPGQQFNALFAVAWAILYLSLASSQPNTVNIFGFTYQQFAMIFLLMAF